MNESTTQVKFRKSNRCWIVLAGCCLMAAVGFSIPITCWTVCMTPIIKSIGIGYTQAAMYMTAVTFASIIGLVAAPKLIQYGAGKLVAISGAISACGFFLIAAAPSPTTIVAAGVIVGLTYMLTSLYTAPVVIKNWFAVKQGAFTAIALAFIGVGGMILSPLTTSLISSFGWQTTMIILGIASIVIQVIVGAFMIRLSPIPMGILPYGATEEDVERILSTGKMEEDSSKVPGLKFGESFKTPVAWIMLVVFLGLGAMATVTTNVNPMIQKFGFTAAAAGIALSAGSLGNITGKLVMGWATDKHGAQFGCLVAAIMAIAGFVGYILSFTVVQSESFLFVSAFICGNGCCMATMMPPLVGMDAFGPKDYDRIYGFFSAIRGFMAALMSMMVGAMVDASGTYMSTLVFWIVACLVLVPFAYIGIKVGQKYWKKQSSDENAAVA